MEELKDKIDLERLPRHIAIIMDGNGRWAQQQGKPRVFGHQIGVESVRETTEAATELGIEYLTLYTFSTENWNRPPEEVEALMTLLVDTIESELPTLNKNGIRLAAIGNLKRLPARSQEKLAGAIEATNGNEKTTLVLALNYSSKWEIVDAAKQLAARVERGELTSADIDEATFVDALSTSGIPDPELLIRTSGESRLSNFLLWQVAYSEFYFTKTFWPDFRKPHLYRAILDYQHRQRRFGLIGEQVG